MTNTPFNPKHLTLLSLALLLPGPALASVLSSGCVLPVSVLNTAYTQATLVTLPLSIITYTAITKRFPTLPLITLALYSLFSTVAYIAGSGLYSTMSCTSISNLQILEDPRPYIAVGYLSLALLLTFYQIYKNRRQEIKGKTLALRLHLALVIAPAAYATLTLSVYTYTHP